MKNNFYILFFASFIPVIFLSCERPPELPHEPKIAFKSVRFYEGANLQVYDTLKITITFEDGNGDIGLTRNDSGFPFHEFTYFSRKNPKQEIYDLAAYQGELLQLGDEPGGYDTLPPYTLYGGINKTDCINYRILPKDSVDMDTIYVQRNKYNRNYILDFFILKDGEYQEFDFLKETCITSDGRILPLNDSDRDRPLEGELTYNWPASRLKTYFADDTIKLRIQIIDRALNESNIVESPPFTLDEIKIN